MLYLKLAWRNIWRNKRRTLITAFSVLLAVVLSALTRSMQLGSYEMMIENTAGHITGYLQIHKHGYWDDQTLDNSFVITDSLKSALASEKKVTTWVPRVSGFALAAGQKITRAAYILGIDPQKEKSLGNPEHYLVKGKYWSSEKARSVIIGDELAKQLDLTPGDTLVLIGQGYHGQSAAGKYPVAGIVHMPDPTMNRALVYMPISESQFFFAMPNHVTAIAILTEHPQEGPQVASDLRKKLASSDGKATTEYEVMTWQKLMPDMNQMIQADDRGGIIFLFILYLIIGFGILGTILMMTAERRKELGIMLSVGMSRLRLGGLLLTEGVMIAMIGTLVGLAVSLPILGYFYLHPIPLTGDMAKMMLEFGVEPILPFSMAPSIFYNQALTVLILAMFFSFYPVWYTHRLDPGKALRP